MTFKVRCTKCGAEFWLRGSYDPDTNGLEFGDEVIRGEACDCGDELTVIEEETDNES